jgi:hypothetical protein
MRGKPRLSPGGAIRRGRRERGGGGLKDEDQDVDLPDLGDERQRQGDGGPDKVHGDEKGAPGQPVGEGADNGRHAT